MTDTPDVVATLPPAPTVTMMPGLVPGSPIDLAGELKTYFMTFYQARTLIPGGRFDQETISEITGSPYHEYTIGLLQQNQADADSGQLQQVTYSQISAQVTDQGTDSVGTALVVVELTRTLTEVREGTPPAPQTGTYQFRLKHCRSRWPA